VRVQGDGAAQDIARAIAELNSDALPGVDVIVVGRGGGSAEDLAQFNEEILARAIFDSAIPVVSAVGHEIDFTIADFTADLRAPTPSAAAELIAPDRAEMLRRLGANQSLLTRKVGDILAQWKSRLDFSARGALLREPRSLVAEGWQSLDLAERSLDYALQTQMAQSRKRIDDVSGRLREHRPDHHLEIRRLAIADLSARMRQHTAARFQMARNSLDRLNAMLRVLAPEATLLRGFSITTDASGALVRSAGQVKKGGKIHTRLSDGSLSSVVEATAL